MVSPVDVGFVGYFLPIFAFLLVFVVIYAILQKTKVLGDNQAVSLFISFIMASFFVVDIQLVDFVTLTSTWFSVFVVLIFFLFLILAFVPGEAPLSFLSKGNWFSWALLAFMIIFFIISSSYIFNWVINWDYIMSGTDSEWFGFFLLIVIGGVVSFILTKKVK
jgi:hypothetical protein